MAGRRVHLEDGFAKVTPATCQAAIAAMRAEEDRYWRRIWKSQKSKVLESGEFCKKTKLNTRGYPCTLGVPTQSVDQKGYPLAQAHCTPFAQSCSLFVWFAPASE